MSKLSLLFRALSVCSAIVVVVFYVLGGNHMKKLESRLEKEISLSEKQKQQLEEKKSEYLKIRGQLDTTVLELANFKREKRLNESQVLLVKQELEKTQRVLEVTETTKLSLLDENDALKRETIELKAQQFDPTANSQVFTSQIEKQRAHIRELESQLNDTQTVVRSLFAAETASIDSFSHEMLPKVQIERFIPEHQLLVLNAGSDSGIQPNTRLQLMNNGSQIATVRVARVTADLCVVNIITNHDTAGNVLQPGTQIEYMLFSS